jgi:hypothetical protein
VTQLSDTAWFRQLTAHPTDELLDDLNTRLDTALWNDAMADDVSVVVLTVA